MKTGPGQKHEKEALRGTKEHRGMTRGTRRHTNNGSTDKRWQLRKNRLHKKEMIGVYCPRNKKEGKNGRRGISATPGVEWREETSSKLKHGGKGNNRSAYPGGTKKKIRSRQ